MEQTVENVLPGLGKYKKQGSSSLKRIFQQTVFHSDEP